MASTNLRRWEMLGKSTIVERRSPLPDVVTDPEPCVELCSVPLDPWRRRPARCNDIRGGGRWAKLDSYILNRVWTDLNEITCTEMKFRATSRVGVKNNMNLG